MRDTKASYRTYTKEFKVEALELLKRGDKSSAQIERDLGITDGLLLKWRDRYQVKEKEGQASQLEPSDIEAAKAEIRRLQRELSNAEEEREILKKVVNIFSRKNG
jgi:transposase